VSSNFKGETRQSLQSLQVLQLLQLAYFISVQLQPVELVMLGGQGFQLLQRLNAVEGQNQLCELEKRGDP